jgi:hypothetical protein
MKRRTPKETVQEKMRNPRTAQERMRVMVAQEAEVVGAEATRAGEESDHPFQVPPHQKAPKVAEKALNAPGRGASRPRWMIILHLVPTKQPRT